MFVLFCTKFYLHLHSSCKFINSKMILTFTLPWFCFSQTITRHRPRARQTQWSRSYTPETVANAPPSAEDEVFFDLPPKTPEDVIDSTQEVGFAPQAEAAPIYYGGTATRGWRRQPHPSTRGGGRVDEHGAPTVGCSRIFSSLLDRVLDNSNRREYGMGWVGKMFGWVFNTFLYCKYFKNKAAFQ